MLANKYRTHHLGELRPAHVGETVRVSGWVETIRDHGGVLFIDLRDQYGITQVVVHDDSLLKNVRRECVIKAEGTVTLRDEETVNPKLDTGLVEVRASNIEILGEALANLPFEIQNAHDTREDVRLKYRFLDLRSKRLHENIMLRSSVINRIRVMMQKLGFTEITTPILTASSPEGARDYIIPSRKHPGMFYALPQAPQIFKQLLMVSGFDKYYQIAPCFRDEDARADRSPGEFYQLDFEMAFSTQEDVFAVAEEVMFDLFTEFGDKTVTPAPFIRIPYAQAMLKYGTDKPDLRNPLEIVDLTEFFAGVEFPAFKNKPTRGIVVKKCALQSKSFFENMLEFAFSIGMKGLGYISVANDGALKGPIVKFLSEEQQKYLTASLDMSATDTVFFISDAKKAVDRLAGQIRTELANRLKLIDESRFEFCFITDYPMYELNPETGRFDFTHNPFSMPQGELEALETKKPDEILAYQYDIVCNGVELSSGAVRNHRTDVMRRAFEIAGYGEGELEQKFGALYNAFLYGAPPHAGMAPGIDRILMLLTGEESIREVIAFPMNSMAQDLLMGAPGPVEDAQLRETNIRVRSTT